MKLFCSERSAYPWMLTQNFAFRGYFIAGGQCLRGKQAINYLVAQLESNNSQTALSHLCGVFSFVYEQDNSVLFAVDRLRGLPLFYSVMNGELWVGDDAQALARELPTITLSSLSAEEFLSTGLFVTGSNTLLNELSQVRAAEFCRFDKFTGQVVGTEYFHTEHKNFIDDSDTETLHREFHKAYQNTGKNLVLALNGRTAVVPLSGGADSRMILSMLKQENYTKVLCFTYGRAGNYEAEISKMVAAEFGYDWVMIPYTNDMWQALRNDRQTADYEAFAFAYTSTPHMQDYLAVKALKEQGRLSVDSVFVPGHTGDLITGGHITSEFLRPSMTENIFLETIYSKFYNEVSHSLSQKISSRFSDIGGLSVELLASKSEWFNIQERQAKFVVNSVRAYEYFGYEWLIPLWDNTQFEYWEHVSLACRYRRKLYYAVVNDQLISTNDETIKKKFAAQIRSIPGLRTIARRIQRMINYKRSTLGVEQLYPFGRYFRACFTEPATFSINNLISQDIVAKLKKEIASHET